MANQKNLKPFKKGFDKRRGTKPKGSKHISTHIQGILNDDEFEYTLNGRKTKGVPLKAILGAVTQKAINGDLRAFDLLAKHGYSQKIDLTMQGEVHKGMSIQEIDAILKRADDYEKEQKRLKIEKIKLQQ